MLSGDPSPELPSLKWSPTSLGQESQGTSQGDQSFHQASCQLRAGSAGLAAVLALPGAGCARTAICRATWGMTLGNGSRTKISPIWLIKSYLRGLGQESEVRGRETPGALVMETLMETSVPGSWSPAARGSMCPTTHQLFGTVSITMQDSLLLQQELMFLDKPQSPRP